VCLLPIQQAEDLRGTPRRAGARRRPAESRTAGEGAEPGVGKARLTLEHTERARAAGSPALVRRAVEAGGAFPAAAPAALGLAAADAGSSVSAMDVLARNNVTMSGLADGPPLVFAHGFGCDKAMWRYVAPAFEQSHRVVLFDHVGAGGSDLSAYDPTRYTRLEAYADDLVEILESLDLNAATVVGHSVSAVIALLAAADRPQLFDRLVLVGPSPRYIDDEGYRGGFSQDEIDELLATMDDNYLGWSAHVASVIMGTPDRPELGEELSSSFCRTDPAVARRFARATFLSDNRADLARVRTPALVVQCRQDVIAPLEVGEYVHRNLAGSELVVLDATGHCPNLSAPDALVSAMQRYLNAP
jgi:sigma-B regulation protein RsbQ